MSIYVEIMMHTDLERLWEFTQTPEHHAQWDLRFNTITYLPRPDVTKPQQFLYTTRIGFGLAITGKGETVGSKETKEGSVTSALKFWSDDALSLISEGSGYWQYVPTSEGVRFLTRYSYRTRFGLIGQCFDRFLFRPLMGWATAWSFDRLRLWLEKDIGPQVSLERSAIYCATRLTLAFIWIYQGLVPKLLFRDTGELTLLQHTHLFPGSEGLILSLVGLGEIVFGGLFLFWWHSRFVSLLNILLLFLLGLGALLSQPPVFVAPFNPLTLSLAMIALSVIGLWSGHDLPSARFCRRKPQENTL